MAWIGIFILVAAGLILVVTHDSGTVGALGSDQFADLARLGALALVIGAGATVVMRQRWRGALLAALAWGALALVLVGLYAYRDELSAVGTRIYAEVVPGAAVSERGEQGETVVRVRRGAGGQFAVDATVNGARMPMLVDTGASAVTLTDEDARAAGFDPAALSFSVPVHTANGLAYVASVTFEEVTIGDIVATNVRGLIARPGVLQRSLLGMTFLERLDGYEVRGDTLLLRSPALSARI